MDNKSHTPTPWKRVPIGGSSMIVAQESPRCNQRAIPIGFKEENGYSIALPFWSDNTGEKTYRPDFVEFSHDDAEIIVRAVNSYASDRALIEKLVEALKECADARMPGQARMIAREALSLAESRLGAKGDGG